MSMQEDLENVLELAEPLSAISDFVWKSLSAAVRVGGHPFAAGCFATVSAAAHDHQPKARTVILRNVEPVEKTLDFYTDARSAKVKELLNTSVCWLFYDRSSKIQLRLEGFATVIDGESADAAWQQTPLESRSAYLSVATPGARVQIPQPPATTDRRLSPEETEKGRVNFRIVRTSVKEAELLYLRNEGHLRATVEYRSEAPKAFWQIP